MADGNLEIGVHIADVSYFVKEYTALDETARSRATSVYLTQKVIFIVTSCLLSSYYSLCSGDPHVTKVTV